MFPISGGVRKNKPKRAPFPLGVGWPWPGLGEAQHTQQLPNVLPRGEGCCMWDKGHLQVQTSQQESRGCTKGHCAPVNQEASRKNSKRAEFMQNGLPGGCARGSLALLEQLFRWWAFCKQEKSSDSGLLGIFSTGPISRTCISCLPPGPS